MRIDNETLEYAKKTFGPAAEDRLIDWKRMLDVTAATAETHMESLEAVNQFFNSRMLYASDIQVWGTKEYWATPFEFLCKGVGDCEDFAIAKFFTLKEIGVPEVTLNIMYGIRRCFGTAHMALAYFPKLDTDPLILDNIVDEIRKESERKDLRFSLGFNTYGLWPAKQRSNNNAMLAADRLKKWRELQTRLAKAARP